MPALSTPCHSILLVGESCIYLTVSTPTTNYNNRWVNMDLISTAEVPRLLAAYYIRTLFATKQAATLALAERTGGYVGVWLTSIRE